MNVKSIVGRGRSAKKIKGKQVKVSDPSAVPGATFQTIRVVKKAL